MKLALALLFLLLLVGAGLAWGMVWNPINAKLQNDPVIGNQLMIQIQVQEPGNVTKQPMMKISYVDADGNASSTTFPVSGNTFIMQGEILHLLWSPARFHLAIVGTNSKNIRTLSSQEQNFHDPALNSPGSDQVLTITNCAVIIGPINDTHLHTYTIIVVPDGTSANSCLLSNG